ncbi:MAG: 30S ribosomal protein S17 [Patescibacteria group bacterium]|jgi:small subunit ribosomal protein S17
MTKRTFQGKVVSAKQNKTIVVQIDRVRTHRLYKKRYTVSQRYQVHDENKTAKVDDVVKFIECRPLSKCKKWRLVTN